VRDFLAWLLLLTVIASWLVLPFRSEPALRLFNAESDEELLRRFAENRRFLAAVGLVLLLDVVAVALSLVILI
jgi:hypothetical protein